jgi:probable phosphoglycerate mutase
MRIVFVRHGEPDYENDCLTAEGRRQAAAAAEFAEEESKKEGKTEE